MDKDMNVGEQQLSREGAYKRIIFTIDNYFNNSIDPQCQVE